MRVEVAREALRVAHYRAEQQVGTTAEIPELELDVVRAERALAELKAMEVQRVSINVKDEKLTAVFTRLFEGTGQCLMLDPAIADNATPVTLTLTDVGLESAVRAICKLYNLEYETDNEGLWVIMPGSGFVTVGGSRVPIVGTVTSLPVTQGGDTQLTLRGMGVSPGGGGGGGGGRGIREARNRPSFVGDERLVDLDVKDAPLSEVASRLSFMADPQPTWSQEGKYNVEIIADDAVKDLKVTARIAKWPLGEVLDMLLAQTGLVCTVDAPGGIAVMRSMSSGEVLSRHYEIQQDTVTEEPVYPTIRVYLVPAPEMRVSGEGLPSEALVGRSMTITRAAKGWADELRVLRFSQECPKCHASILLPEWTFCPYCGAEAVAEEGQPEGGD